MSVNNIVNLNGKEYELLYVYDSDYDDCNTCGTYSELKDKINLEEIFYFDSSYKNQLTYFNKDKSITIFCIDYRYGFNTEHKLLDLCSAVDVYSIYRRTNV